ncbi:MAG: ATP-dependent zinc protease [Rhodospirillales bacterium]|nr:ATP-dependent zinc protease [Rhodospirillales bacterium]
MEKKRKRAAGWREWVSLPSIGVGSIKAKLDTGARTSALHAFNIETYWSNGELWARFFVHPYQENDAKEIACDARIEDIRIVSNPGGRRQRRLVIRTDIRLGDETWLIDLSLTDRDEMGFRLLIGRTAMHGNLIVDPDHSYLLGKRKRKKKKKKKKHKLKERKKAKKAKKIKMSKWSRKPTGFARLIT